METHADLIVAGGGIEPPARDYEAQAPTRHPAAFSRCLAPRAAVQFAMT